MPRKMLIEIRKIEITTSEATGKFHRTWALHNIRACQVAQGDKNVKIVRMINVTLSEDRVWGSISSLDKLRLGF